MKIVEITRPPTHLHAMDVLRKAGYERLGMKGSYGAVFHKPGAKYVLKIFDAEDAAYRAFVELAKTYTNPHFPRFFGKLVEITPAYQAIRMEFLTPYHNDPTLIYHYLRYRNIIQKIPPEARRDFSDTASRFDDALELMEEIPTLRVACDLIIDHLLPHFDLDLQARPDNLMVRNKTIVFTDPVKNRNM